MSFRNSRGNKRKLDGSDGGEEQASKKARVTAKGEAEAADTKAEPAEIHEMADYWGKATAIEEIAEYLVNSPILDSNHLKSIMKQWNPLAYDKAIANRNNVPKSLDELKNQLNKLPLVSRKTIHSYRLKNREELVYNNFRKCFQALVIHLESGQEPNRTFIEFCARTMKPVIFNNATREARDEIQIQTFLAAEMKNPPQGPLNPYQQEIGEVQQWQRQQLQNMHLKTRQELMELLHQQHPRLVHELQRWLALFNRIQRAPQAQQALQVPLPIQTSSSSDSESILDDELAYPEKETLTPEQQNLARTIYTPVKLPAGFESDDELCANSSSSPEPLPGASNFGTGGSPLSAFSLTVSPEFSDDDLELAASLLREDIFGNRLR